MLTDFHTHTTASDGTMAPEESLEYARKCGITHMAVTDHDSAGSLDRFMEKAKEFGITPVAGIEFGCPYKKGEVHILGYGMDWKNAKFHDAIEKLQKSRIGRIEKTLNILHDCGIELSMNDLLQGSGGNPGRLHIARAAVKKGYFADEHEIFESLIGEGKKAYVKKETLSVHEASELVKQAGGITVVAHPGVTGLSRDDLEFMVSEGVGGIEVFYPEHLPDYRKTLELFAADRGIIVTGGSDFHGVRNGKLTSIGMPDYPQKHFRKFMEKIGVTEGESI
ncbi:MAG: PHP domain-containing protein [bacterium]|nr:PHP domain-containing protein [bacterium]